MPKAILTRPKPRDRRDVWNADLLDGSSYAGKYEMPVIPACNVVPKKLTAFSSANENRADTAFIHCFEYDYKFERLWRNPRRYLKRIQAYGGAIAPDFSLYREMPLSQQIHNVFKGRVLAYWWSRNEIAVIPNVRWGDERTYDFCFDGLPQNSVVAVGTHGCVKRRDDLRYFLNGLVVMLERVKPATVIVYGSASDKIFPPLFVHNVNIIRFESDFSQSRKRQAV